MNEYGWFTSTLLFELVEMFSYRNELYIEFIFTEEFVYITKVINKIWHILESLPT